MGGGMGGVSSTGYGQPSGQTTPAVANQTMAPAASVSDLYRNVLNRDPDQAGLDYWNSQASSGMSLNAIRDSFLNSQEFAESPTAQQHYLQYMQSQQTSPVAQAPQAPVASAPATPYVPVTTTFTAQSQQPVFNQAVASQSGDSGGAINYQFNRGGIASLVRR